MIRIEGLRFRYPAAEGDFTLRIPRFDLKTGERLAISIKTVSTYRTRILQKMNMKTNAELIRYAIENKLLD